MRGLIADVVRSSVVDGPGHRYVVFCQGCTFNCIGCHNPHTIAPRPTQGAREVEVDELVAEIAEVAPFLSGVTVSGGEATMQWEFVHALFEQLALEPATARLTRLVDSNGDADPEVWTTLSTSMHGAMLDLKALDPEVHRYLTGRGNERVLASMEQLARLYRLNEVRLLIVPGINDDPAQLAATARFLRGLEPAPAVVVQGFRRHGTRPAAHGFQEAERRHLEVVVDALVGHGLVAERVRMRGVATEIDAATPVLLRA